MNVQTFLDGALVLVDGEWRKPREYIVMTSSAKMPSSCKGNYRKVAVCLVEAGNHPTRIDERAKGMIKIISCGEYSVGKTAKSAYAQQLAKATQEVARLNSERP